MADSSPVHTPRTRGPAAAARSQRAQYLAFGLGGSTFAMEIRCVREVLRFVDLTRIPLMPAFVKGVLNLRGAVVPVLDLALRLGGDPSQVSQRTCIVILEVPREEGALTLGVIVDHVNEVLELDAADIEAPPSVGRSLRSEFIQGVGKVEGRFIILLSVQNLLEEDEVGELLQAARELPAARVDEGAANP